jgi:hypothetical protein
LSLPLSIRKSGNGADHEVAIPQNKYADRLAGDFMSDVDPKLKRLHL